MTPLQLSQFQAELHDYSDQSAAAYVLTGPQEDFHIGFDAPSVSLQSASSEVLSALEHPWVADDYLIEVSCGRVAGPFATPPVPGMHVSHFGVIPKQPARYVFNRGFVISRGP